jgi:hypothetical protein
MPCVNITYFMTRPNRKKTANIYKVHVALKGGNDELSNVKKKKKGGIRNYASPLGEGGEAATSQVT